MKSSDQYQGQEQENLIQNVDTMVGSYLDDIYNLAGIEHQVDEIFAVFDTTRSGLLRKDEAIEWIKSVYHELE